MGNVGDDAFTKLFNLIIGTQQALIFIELYNLKITREVSYHRTKNILKNHVHFREIYYWMFIKPKSYIEPSTKQNTSGESKEIDKKYMVQYILKNGLMRETYPFQGSLKQPILEELGNISPWLPYDRLPPIPQGSYMTLNLLDQALAAE